MAKKEPKANGRPTIFSEALAQEICLKISQGESLKKICEASEMPCIASVFGWIHSKPGFLDKYETAIEQRTIALGEELLEITDDGSNDWMERNYGEQTAWVTNGEALQRSKLRVETRKWLMSKMKPKKYGDKIDITSDGKVLPTPILGLVSHVSANNSTKKDSSTKETP